MSQHSAAGIAVSSYFQNWDKSKITHIFSPFLRSALPDFSICNDYRQLNWDGSISIIDDPSKKIRSNSLKPKSKIKDILAANPFLQNLGIPLRNLWLGRNRYSKGLQNELTKIQPEMVYAWPSSKYLAKAILTACRNLELPLFIHVVDDYVYKSRRLRKLLNIHFHGADYWLEQIASYSSGRATIGPHMASEYGYRYGGEWTWFTTLVSKDDYSAEFQISHYEDNIQIVFMGNIGYDRWKTLKELGEELARLSNGGVSVNLHIYASLTDIKLYGEQLAIPGVIDVREWVPSEDLPRILQNADILLHVEPTDNSKYIPAIRWSLSTKISQYMMAGRCIMAIGSQSLASMQFISESGSGVVLHSIPKQRNKLKEFLGNKSLMREYGRQARRKALEYFEAEKQRDRFRMCMKETIIAHNNRRSGK